MININGFKKLTILSEENKKDIHNASIALLEGVGFQINYEPALKVLSEHGVKVDFPEKKVYLTEEIIESCLKKAPSKVTLCGRNPENDMELDGEFGSYSYSGTLGSVPYIYDLKTGERRPGTSDDLKMFARLADGLTNMDYFHVMVMPNDIDAEVLALKRWAITFENISKHAMTAAGYMPEDVDWVIKLAGEVVGGVDKLKERPIFSATECPTEPLRFGARAAENICKLAKHDIPVIIYTEPMAGATSPITMASTIVMTNAEVLMAVVLMQLINPGCPVIYGSVASGFDMRAANVAFGSPETGLFNAATTAMARYYKLPNLTTGGRCDSKAVDAQAGMEKTRNFMLAAMAGSTLNNMGGSLEGNLSVDFAQLVVDNEIVAEVRRVLQGISFNQEDFALDIIKEVGIGGNFLKNMHTLKRLKDQHYFPELSNRSTYGDWLAKGGKDMAKRAREKAENIIKEHEVQPLADDTIKAMNDIVSERMRMLKN